MAARHSTVYMCPYCQGEEQRATITASIAKHKEHMLLKHMEPSFPCPVCPMSLRSKAALAAHMGREDHLELIHRWSRGDRQFVWDYLYGIRYIPGNIAVHPVPPDVIQGAMNLSRLRRN